MMETPLERRQREQNRALEARVKELESRYAVNTHDCSWRARAEKAEADLAALVERVKCSNAYPETQAFILKRAAGRTEER